MMSFKFFCGINLSFKALQAEAISAVESQKTAKLSLETLERMQSQENSNGFFDTVKSKVGKIDFIGKPFLPWKKWTPNNRTLEYRVSSIRCTWKFSTNLVWSPWFDYFGYRTEINQPSFQAYMKMESFLLKAINGSYTRDKHDFLHENYHDDIEFDHLEAEKEDWKAIFIHKTIKALPSSKKLMIPTFTKLSELILVNPATSCTAKRSFSTTQGLKTWLRSTMTNQRFNSLAILNAYKTFTDKLDLCKIGNNFISKNNERYNLFGRFSEADFI